MNVKSNQNGKKVLLRIRRYTDGMKTVGALLALLIVPLIVCILLWVFLEPVTFWQRLVMLAVDCFLFIIIIILELIVLP